ncbi:MAG: hypothetical protein E7653_04635 [Ruminococcaceae bacterium]|nr:hypothetical protein [Oscillospiraceae bacterium]
MSIVFKFIKRLVIALVSLVVAGVIALLLWRVFSSENPKAMETLTPTDKLVAEYNKSGDELYMFNQKQRSITSAEDNYGYFSITDYAIIPEANEIQTLFRYNTSTLKHTAEDHALEAVPSRDSEVYEVTLLLAIDLTPDNQDDNLGNDPESVRFVRCKGSTVGSDKKNMYNYRRVVFQLDDADVNIKQLLDQRLLLAIYADICYLGDINYDDPDGTLCLYDYLSPNVRLELDKRDVKVLTGKE